jgi:hypothetical protein
MKLTNYMRDAFVRRVMDDVPCVDYTEDIRAEVMKTAVAALPPKIRAVWADKSLRCHLHTSYFNVLSVSVANVPMPSDASYKAAQKHLQDAVAGLVAKSKEQADKRDSLESKLQQCAYSATTRKALAGMLPEFEKYLPADETAALRSVPVVANVVADFVKAGWPKDAKKQAARATA